MGGKYSSIQKKHRYLGECHGRWEEQLDCPIGFGERNNIFITQRYHMSTPAVPQTNKRRCAQSKGSNLEAVKLEIVNNMMYLLTMAAMMV